MQNLIFRFLQSRQKIQVWLYDRSDMRIEGRIVVRFFLFLFFFPRWEEGRPRQRSGGKNTPTQDDAARA